MFWPQNGRQAHYPLEKHVLSDKLLDGTFITARSQVPPSILYKPSGGSDAGHLVKERVQAPVSEDGDHLIRVGKAYAKPVRTAGRHTVDR